MSEPIVEENKGTVCTDFTVRWTMQLGQPQFGVWGSRGGALEQLAKPRSGALSGELVQRTTTTSPWSVVPDVPAVQGLFAQPEHDYSVLAGFPAELVKTTENHNGLRYTYVGDDGEWLIILGHPARAELDALPTWLDIEPEGKPETTYGRLLWECPDHKPGTVLPDEEYCRVCAELAPGAWWLHWGVGEDEKPDANAGKPGYFPIVAWEVGV